MRKILLSLMLVTISLFTYSQNAISGTVTDDSGEGLPGVTVLIKGTQSGTITDVNGNFKLNVAEGTPLIVSYVGFKSIEVSASNDVKITMKPGTSILAEVVISSNVIDVVKERETPVAVSSISPAEISLKVGNMEFPEIMNRTPSVYATKQGGGYGDSRVTLRGFDQTNTSFLINGQPVNDMENGAVFWSNWQGLTDIASGIQIQRGLGASRLAVPSVGGTVSIFTKAADRTRGGRASQVIGNDGYLKSTASYSTGKNDKGWAASVLLSSWQGDGYVDATKGKGLTYFAAVGYEPEGSDHAINFSFLGAGQWHHQRSTNVSIRDYQNFGDDKKEGIDRRWNTDGGMLDGKEFNMRRNFYNKPLATINWDWKITNNLSLATSLYGSAGRGGGTGPRGGNFRNGDIDINPFRTDLTDHSTADSNEDGIPDNRGRNADGTIDFDNVISVNRTTTSGYTGSISGYEGLKIGSNGFNDDNVNRAVLIRRASINSHNWVGGISSLKYEGDKFTYSLGVDLRKYTGYHYRVVNNLMGLDGYYSGNSGSNGNQNNGGLIIETTNAAKPFGDTGINGPKIDYYNIGHVAWSGLNGMIEYSSNEKITAVLQAGVSNQGFQREDFFDQVGNPLSETQNQKGGYLKGGANYNVSDKSNVFFNAGFISRQPNFDAVFPGFENDINANLQNEVIQSVELGYGYLGRNLTVNVNAYSTSWGNRFITRGFDISDTEEGSVQFDDVDVLHQGIEIEATYRPINNLKLRGMASIGDWRYTKDFTGEVFDESRTARPELSQTIYVDGEKVGDAAQLTAYVSADYRFKFLSVDLGYRFADNLYADYSIEDESLTTEDNDGALKLPSFGLVDLGVTASFDLFGNKSTFRVNVNNLFDTVYIAESNTNIHVGSDNADGNTFNGIDVRNEVWFGFGRTWNATLTVNF